MPRQILVVDDDPEIARKLREMLAPEQVGVETATGAPEAIAMLESRSFCGMVLDLMLHESSGFDVLHHLAQKRLTVPTIVVTSKLPSYVREMLSAEQVKLVFPKPVDPRLLASIVSGLCG